GRVRKVELHAGIGQQPGEERKPLAIVEFSSLNAVARALQRLGNGDAMIADHTVLVRQGAIDHRAVLDEALHTDAEQLEIDDARGVEVVLERSAVVRGTPRIEGRITLR